MSKRHLKRLDDTIEMVKDLTSIRTFDYIPGRYHVGFEGFINPTHDIDNLCYVDKMVYLNQRLYGTRKLALNSKKK